MEIKGKVYCMFEQSGTFKNEFIKLGIPAVDLDIQNNFGETDYVIDLFSEIEKAYEGEASIFDSITCDDLIMAFFPCIYFTGSTNPVLFRLDDRNYWNLTMREKMGAIIERAENRNTFYKILLKMCGTCLERGLRLILENPYNSQHYLYNNFLQEPAFVDKNRQLRGDVFKKPTGYWFFGCEPTYGLSMSKPEKTATIYGIKGSKIAGLCGEERSMISPVYARNFICDFIIGKTQSFTQMSLFGNE